MYDVIIPARNEEKTIGNIVRVFKSHPDIGDVIVVRDDDTIDNTADIAIGQRALLVYGPTGKGQCIKMGLHYVRSQWVILCDADLSGLTTEHIDTMISGDGFVIGVPDFPLTEILCSPKMTWEWIPRIFETYAWVSGERVVKTDLLKTLDLHGYLTEVQINHMYRMHGIHPQFHHLRGLYSPFKMDDRRMKELVRDRIWGEQNGIFEKR